MAGGFGSLGFGINIGSAIGAAGRSSAVQNKLKDIEEQRQQQQQASAFEDQRAKEDAATAEVAKGYQDRLNAPAVGLPAKPAAAAPSPYQSNQADLDQLRARIFQTQRDRANQQVNQAQTQGMEALNRRFAALGNSNSGEAIKQQQLLGQRAAEQRQAVNEGLNMQELQSRLTGGETEAQRQFASGEAEKQRQFQGGLADQDRAMKEKIFAFDQSSKLRQLDQADRQLASQEEADKFNKMLAEYQFRRAKQGLLPGLGEDIFGAGTGAGVVGTIGNAVKGIIGGFGG